MYLYISYVITAKMAKTDSGIMKIVIIDNFPHNLGFIMIAKISVEGMSKERKNLMGHLCNIKASFQ